MGPRRKLAVKFATTQDLMDAAGVQRRTIWVWIQRGLLPMPVMISQGHPGGTFNRFPASALGAARFIAAKRAGGFTYDEVRVMLAEMDKQEARKAKAAARPQAPPATPKGGRRR